MIWAIWTRSRVYSITVCLLHIVVRTREKESVVVLWRTNSTFPSSLWDYKTSTFSGGTHPYWAVLEWGPV